MVAPSTLAAHLGGLAVLLALSLAKRRRQSENASAERQEGAVQWQLHPSCFFRPEAEPARQLGVLAARLLRAERGGFLSVLELFAGSGLRAARYLVEGGAEFVWANEANQDVYQALVANVASVGNGRGSTLGCCDDLLPEWAAPARSWSLQPGLPLHGCEGGAAPGWRHLGFRADKDSGSEARGWRVTHWDARALLGYCLAIHRQFDLVDVDAFGAWGHLKDALEVVRPGGLLYLTATGLTAWKPSRSFRRLGMRGRCPPQETLHDQMCRALVWHVVTLADHVSLVAEPLFTLYRQDGDVYRVMFRVTRRFGESRLDPQMLGLCRACNNLLGPFEEDLVLGVHRPSCDCGSSEVVTRLQAFWGPVWTGQLQSDDFLQQLERVAEGLCQPLQDLRGEASKATKPWTLRLAEVARRAQRPPVKMEKLLQDVDWDMEVEKPQATLSHSACPWGGQLIRVAVAAITVSDAPVKKSHVLVRPETRAAFGSGAESLLEHFAPGDAVVQRWADWGLLRLCSILFGDMAGSTFTTAARNLKTAPVLTHQRLRRDFPSPGDAAYAFFHEGDDAQEGFLMCSPTVATENKFDLVGVFRMPDEKFTSWTSIHFQLLLDSACRASHWLLNGPRTREMRQADVEAYVVLTIQSCKRGLPLYPFVATFHGAESEPTVSIVAGEHLGLDKWIRFSPGQVGSEKFRLSDYIQLFLQSLGEAVPIYSVMDGRKLVPYQCVVRREDWLRVRQQFVECFLLQKTAYRRANGGSTAPSLHEDVDPRFITERSPPAEAPRTVRRGTATAGVRVVVRRTFVEVESEDDSDDDVHVPSERQSRRPKTTTILPVEISVA